MTTSVFAEIYGCSLKGHLSRHEILILLRLCLNVEFVDDDGNIFGRFYGKGFINLESIGFITKDVELIQINFLWLFQSVWHFCW